MPVHGGRRRKHRVLKSFPVEVVGLRLLGRFDAMQRGRITFPSSDCVQLAIATFLIETPLKKIMVIMGEGVASHESKQGA